MNENELSRTAEKIEEFIKRKVREANANGVVVGLSGGIDSTTTAFLCVRALGKERVLGVIMPEKGVTPEEDVKDAIEVCRILGINYKIVEISDIFNAFIRVLGKSNKISEGNLKARIRMCILYYFANSMNYLVAGTGNKTELMLGYFTKYGDGGVDFLPIGGLYKTEVRELAKFLGVPEKIISKPPSAGLWRGQKDEEELGMSYDEIDTILKALENGKKVEEIDGARVKRILEMIEKSDHKRSLPETASTQEIL